jgi:hypothetical protein
VLAGHYDYDDNNGDAVFAYVPAYKTGYLHNKEKCKIKTLKNIND